MLPITGCEKPWPFFHFRCHHFWPKLASSILDFCRMNRSFQWCPDQSDRPKGTWDMHNNAQKVERKTQTKIFCHYTWLLHGKNCPSQWRFLRSFLTASKPSRKKEKKRRKRKGKKKNQKIEKPKDKGQNFDFCVCSSQNVLNRDASGKKGKWVWSSLKTNKMSKDRIFCKKLPESMG